MRYGDKRRRRVAKLARANLLSRLRRLDDRRYRSIVVILAFVALADLNRTADICIEIRRSLLPADFRSALKIGEEDARRGLGGESSLAVQIRQEYEREHQCSCARGEQFHAFLLSLLSKDITLRSLHLRSSAQSVAGIFPLFPRSSVFQ